MSLMISYDCLNELQLDVMREIGNIGAGNACTALSVLLGTAIDMSVPRVQLLSYESTAQKLGGVDNAVIGLQIEINGDLEGMMVHVVQKNFAQRIINTFYAKKTLMRWIHRCSMRWQISRVVRMPTQ